MMSKERATHLESFRYELPRGDSHWEAMKESCSKQKRMQSFSRLGHFISCMILGNFNSLSLNFLICKMGVALPFRELLSEVNTALFSYQEWLLQQSQFLLCNYMGFSHYYRMTDNKCAQRSLDYSFFFLTY